MNKSPAFQFYAADFLADENVVLMTNQEVGCYTKLMCYCWREGSIPNDITKIAKLCGENSSAMQELWVAISECFSNSKNDEKRLVHKRLENERLKQIEHKNERALSGKKGAEARWNKEKNGRELAIAEPLAEPMADDAFSFSSSSTTSINNNNPIVPFSENDTSGEKVKEVKQERRKSTGRRKEDMERFDEFWSAYPKKSAKIEAEKAWAKLTTNEKDDVLQDLPIRYIHADWDKLEKKYIPDPSRYLNQKRWTDEIIKQSSSFPNNKPTIKQDFGNKNYGNGGKISEF